MNIEYVARNYSPDDALREHAEKKLEKVAKFVDEPLEVRVTFEVEKHHNIADLHVSHRHGVLQAREETVGDMREALSQVADKVEKQARRSRKKFIDKRRRADRATNGNHRWPLSVVSREGLGDEGGPRVVKSTHLPIEPMTIEEAALVLEDSKNEFVVFRNTESDEVNVLYKRRDDHYGLIAPEQ